MSAPEIAHRLAEVGKRTIDRARRPDWSMFGGFSGEIAGLPGLDRHAAIGDSLRANLDETAQAVFSGQLCFFHRSWPEPDQTVEPWWRTDFWLTDPISGGRWPGAETFAFDVSYRGDPARGDVKFVWELNRLQFLPPLALHAKRGGETTAASHVFEILRGWMTVNTPYQGVAWTSGIEAASRVVSLLALLAFARPATAADGQAARAFLQAHVLWIRRYPSRFSSANNHRVAELTALFLASVCAPGLQGAKRWGAAARKGLEREIGRQFHADGVGAEQSAAYAAYSLEWFVLAGLGGDASGQSFSSAYRDRAARASHHLLWLTDQGGRTPRIGDGDEGRVLALSLLPEPQYAASVAALTARWLDAPRPAAAVLKPALRDLWGRPTPSCPPPIGVRAFEAGGMTVHRRPRVDGGLLLAFDHGPLGHLSVAAHGHADALAIWLHWGEEAVIADPGVHLYHAPEELRDKLRGTAAHNTLCLAGQDQSRIIGPFAWSDHARARLVHTSDCEAEAEHDGYLRRYGLIHRRRVWVGNDYVLIDDRLVGRGKAASLPWSIGFTLAPGIEAALADSQVQVQTPAGRRLTITGETSDGAASSWVVASTPYAPTFGVLEAGTRISSSGLIWPCNRMIRTRIILTTELLHHDRPS